MYYGSLNQMHPHPHFVKYGLSTRLPCFHRKHPKFHTDRRRLNGEAILLNIIVPWVTFCLVLAIVSFRLHFSYPWLCYGLVVLIFALTVGVFAALAQLARVRKHKETHEEHHPMWYNFLTVCCFVAVVSGLILGTMNFTRHTGPYYSLNSLNTYRNVNPANVVGEQLVDAGRVTFQQDVQLDLSHSMAFKDSDIYCVAPIVSNTTSSSTFWDFWVVGKNCCSGPGDFHCKGFQERLNMGGIRLFDDADRPFYRLAVQQAEATYKITTNKPLFFVWEYEPIETTQKLRNIGYTWFYYGLFAALAIQVVAVTSATLVFSKDMPMREPTGHPHHIHL